MTARQKAIVCLVIAHIIWGASTPIIKLSIQSLPPFSFAVIRFWLTSLIMLGYLVIRRKPIEILKSDMLRIFLWGLFAVPVNIALFFWGLEYTSSIHAAAIGSLVPIFTALGGYVFLHERLTKLNLLGISIAFAGSLVIIGSPLFSQTGDGRVVFGNVLNLLAAISWVVGTIIAKDIVSKYPVEVLTTIAFVIGFATLLPLVFVEYHTHPGWLAHLTPVVYIGIAYVVIGNSVLAYSLFNFSLRMVSATAANVASYIMPIAAAALAFPLLGEVPTMPFLIGSAITLVGVFFAETRHQFHPLHTYLHKKLHH